MGKTMVKRIRCDIIEKQSSNRKEVSSPDFFSRSSRISNDREGLRHSEDPEMLPQVKYYYSILKRVM